MHQPAFHDQPLEQRRQEFKALRKNFGKCQSTTPIEPEDALRGRWIMHCRKGRIEVFVTLASIAPPRIQFLQLTTVKPLSPTLKRTITQLVRLMQKWDDAKARPLFAGSLKRKTLRVQFEALYLQYGRLRLGDALEGDGQTQTCVRIQGQRGVVNMKVEVDPKTSKIAKLTFTRPRETAFVP